MQRRDFMLKTAAASLAIGSLTVAGCTTSFNATGSQSSGASGSATDKRQQIDHDVDATLTRLYSTAPESRDLVAKANGVLVFPSVLAAGLGVGGEYGEGALRVHGKTEANYSLGSVSIGFQIGAQSKAIIFLFMTQDMLEKFRKSEGWSIGVDASAALVKIGANGKLDANSISGPLLAFVMTNAGLMANLSLEGTKISRLKL